MRTDTDAPARRQTVALTASTFTVTVDGAAVAVEAGVSVIAALVLASRLCTRLSVNGEARFAFCGMGYCQECRVTIDGQPHRLACQEVCYTGMDIRTGAAEDAA